MCFMIFNDVQNCLYQAWAFRGIFDVLGPFVRRLERQFPAFDDRVADQFVQELRGVRWGAATK